jgi:hypothetical protein
MGILGRQGIIHSQLKNKVKAEITVSVEMKWWLQILVNIAWWYQKQCSKWCISIHIGIWNYHIFMWSASEISVSSLQFTMCTTKSHFLILTQNKDIYLERFLPSVDQLVSFQLWTLHKCLATFSAHVNPRSMSVKVFPHCWVITKHFGASLVWACYCPVHSITHLFLYFHLVTRPRIIRYTSNKCYKSKTR